MSGTSSHVTIDQVDDGTLYYGGGGSVLKITAIGARCVGSIGFASDDPDIGHVETMGSCNVKKCF